MRSDDPWPRVQWGAQSVRFEPGPAGHGAASGATAVVVLVRHAGGWLLADIPGRGWTVPSGRVEAPETADEAAHREAYEEVGATLGALIPLGIYTLTGTDGAEACVPAYVADAVHIGPLPPGSEALGTRVVAPSDLPSVYYTWDALLAAVFERARQALDDAA